MEAMAMDQGPKIEMMKQMMKQIMKPMMKPIMILMINETEGLYHGYNLIAEKNFISIFTVKRVDIQCQ